MSAQAILAGDFQKANTSPGLARFDSGATGRFKDAAKSLWYVRAPATFRWLRKRALPPKSWATPWKKFTILVWPAFID